MEGESAQSVGQNEPHEDEAVIWERRVKLVEHFHKISPPTFTGVEGPEAADEFLEQAEKIFELLECTSPEKVMLATYVLKKEANTWWKAFRETVEEEYEGDAWEQFRQAFLDKYFPFTIREDKAEEFDLLVQTEDMTVDQYEAKFSELSKYNPERVNTQEKRSRKFERGLLPRLQSQVAGFTLTNYGEVYRRAQKIEKTLKECAAHEALKEKRSLFEGTSKGFTKDAKRGRFFRRGGSSSVSRYSGHTQATESMSAPSQPFQCTRCGMWHSGWRCPTGSRGLVTCYQCDQPGHIRRNCPQNQRPVPSAISSASRGRGGPRPQSSRGSVSQTRAQGRVNAIIEAEAAHSTKIITGIILVNGRKAYALFDTGATHSFVLVMYADDVGLFVEDTESTLMVRLSNGLRMATTGRCRNYEIFVGSMISVVDLVIFQMGDFDVILGMDWLEKTYARVDCLKKEIIFLRPNRQSYTYVGRGSGAALEVVSATRALRILEDGCEAYLVVVLNVKKLLPKLQSIDVVCEYSDVFLEELPGLPLRGKLILL